MSDSRALDDPAHAVRWTVGPGDGATVREVLASAGADAGALAEGRVFVLARGLPRTRAASGDEPLRQGDELEVAPAHAQRDHHARILARAGDLVAADKPTGVPTIPDQAGAAHSLLAAVARTLGVPVTTLHPTSRLDRDVSGVVVFALSKVAAARLLSAREQGLYSRRYVALACRVPAPPQGIWDQPIGRAARPRLRAVAGREAAPAVTRYATVAQTASPVALLALAPQTGRTHQIRVHAAHAGCALLGDRDYGGPARITLPSGRVLSPGRIALHAARVVVPAEDGRPLTVESPLPAELAALWLELGGDAAAWEVARTCALD